MHTAIKIFVAAMFGLRLASLPGTSVTWASIVDHMEEMDKREDLSPADYHWLETARANAESENR